MPRRLPSSALDTQSLITAAAGTLAAPAATLSGYWKLDQTLTGGITGNAGTATKWANKVVVNGTDLDGATTPVTIGVNTTSIATSGTYYPTFVPTNVADNQQASTHGSLSYNPNTGYLSATRFVGSGAGLTGVVKSISFNGAAAVSGDLTINQSSYGLGAISGLAGVANIRLYSSSTAGATYTFSTSTSTSILRIVVGLGALDAGETALRAVFYTTNPATNQPYGDLNGNGSVGTGDDSIIAAIAAGVGSATSRSDQLLAAIAASADIGLIVRYGWINSSLANDVSFSGFNGTTVTRSGNTIIFSSASQVQPDWSATSGLGSILNKPTLFDGNYNSLSNKPTIPSVSGTLKEVASWTSSYLGDGLQNFNLGGGPIVSGTQSTGGPLGGWYQTIYYEFDSTYLSAYNAASIAHVHLDYLYPVYWVGHEVGSVMSIAKTYSIVRRQSATGPTLSVVVTIACNKNSYVGADMWPFSITLHFYANQ